MKFTMALWFSYELIRYLDIIGEKKKVESRLWENTDAVRCWQQ